MRQMDPIRDGELVCAARLEFRGSTYTACHLLTFHNPDGDKVGWLNWEHGELTFGGDMAESARMFFAYLKPLVDGYRKAEREKIICIKDTFLSSAAICNCPRCRPERAES